MREVSKDDKWQSEREENDRRRDQSTEEVDALMANTDALGVASQPTETELVIVALLMRLYDLNLALLGHFDQTRADEVFEAHEKGGSFNPPVFIPEMTESGTTENINDAEL